MLAPDLRLSAPHSGQDSGMCKPAHPFWKIKKQTEVILLLWPVKDNSIGTSVKYFVIYHLVFG